MAQPLLQLDRVGKKFCRSLSKRLVYGAQDLLRGSIGAASRAGLRTDEFWALDGISFAVNRGDCLGIIGPNGAGKTTLLRLINRDYRPDLGRIAVRGRVTSLIRLGTGLRPLLTGRENILARGSELGLSQREMAARMDAIVEFSGLGGVIDAPVKQYSDGLYARLEFALATAVPPEILLIDEVLAVGDLAFQMRALERLDELKRGGTAILFVSHSEMNVRHAADRCLLLFDGRALAQGDTDALFLRYYETLGFTDRSLRPLGAAPERPADWEGCLHLSEVRPLPTGAHPVAAGQPLDLDLHYVRRPDAPRQTSLLLEFWSSSGLLLASFDSDRNGGLALTADSGVLRLNLPALGLPPGAYRLAGGFRSAGSWLGYTADLARLTVAADDWQDYPGLFLLNGTVRESRP